MPDAISGLGATAPSPAKPAGTSNSLDKDAFLKLLVAQLKYQNPLQPSDPSQFMAQTAQFTMVERLDELSKAQAEATTWQRTAAGTGLIGKQVAGTVDGQRVEGVVTSLRLTADGGVLQLAGGRTLPVTAVETVTTPAPPQVAPAASTPYAPPSAA